MGHTTNHRSLTLLFPLILVLFALTGCVTVDEQNPPPVTDEEVSPVLQKQIQKRIEGLKFQRGVALLDSLNWLILYGETAIPHLEKALSDPDPRTRSYSAFVLGEIGNDSVVSVLREVQERETHKLVRYEIAASLVTLGDWGQFGTLVEGLEEKSKLLRFKCFDVLRKSLNMTLGYDPDGPEEERAASVAKWRAWWERNKKNFTPVLE